ncbi:matrixin family metalloprotease [Kineosporia succinea]|uniref:Peptidase M10 metallopeptidase domain-containing protein n=1 Tax=Kineosporia succinea TaxID=84632 RepID=A0ABT9NXP2_9ACTN|nr:matrixin family metalloprotease [Kineosporia succinea]MDP9825175.1 hypothetical protein [Kineosporia succinea]
MDHSRTRPVLKVALALTLLALVMVTPMLAFNLTGEKTALGLNYTLRSAQLASGKSTTARWNPCQKAIVWRVNMAGWPASKRPAMLKQIQTSVARVAKVTGMKYRYAGTTTFIPRQENLASAPADIVVAVIDPKKTNFSFSENSLGYGGVLWATWYGSSGEGAAVVRGYAVLIPSGMNKLKPGFGTGNKQGNVVLHELAHAAGLDHVRSKAQQMYPDLTAKSPNGLAPGDVQGLQKIGSKAGCIDVPSRVNITDYN